MAVWILPAGDATLIYISIPSGFSKSAAWYRHINASSGGVDFDFALTTSNETEPFEFVQVTDIHVGGSGNRELLIEALGRIGDLTNPPELVLATGDLVDSGSNRLQYDDYVAAIATSTVPYFSVFGNHDANNSGTSNYRTYLGPDYYSFSYGDCHFLIVNSVFNTPEERQWIERDLALLRGSRRLFIFQHYSPSEAEHADFAARGAKAVFTGHWHSQHTVRVGEMGSYNTANLLFGGIDCSPAGFKIASVTPSAVNTRMKWLADGRRLQIVAPSGDHVFASVAVPIVVNAYETSAEVSSVTYELRLGMTIVTAGALTKQGDWTWTGALRGAMPEEDVDPSHAPPYTLAVTAVNDKGQPNTAQSAFRYSSRHPPPAPTTRDWRQFGGGPRRGGDSGANLEPPFGLVWIADTGGTIDFGSPVLSDGALFIGVKDRRDFERNGVLALDVADGRRLWFSPTPAAVSHAVALDDERVYACSHGGILHAFERSSGQEQWRRVLGSEVQRWLYGAPVVFGSRVYAGTYAYFGSFNAASGSEHWHQSYGGDWISANAAPATDGTRVIVPANWSTNSLRAVNAVNGNTLWQYNVRGLHGSPVIADGKVLCTDWSGYLHAVRIDDGQRVWRQDLGGGRSASTPAVVGNTVVAGGAGRIRAFHLDSGDPLWETTIATSPLKMAPYDNTFAALVGSPTIAGAIAYVPTGDGRLYALDLANGQVLWSLDFGVPILSAPCIAGDYLFLATFDGHVYAFAGAAATEAAP